VEILWNPVLKKCGKRIAKKRGFTETSHRPRPRVPSACDLFVEKLCKTGRSSRVQSIFKKIAAERAIERRNRSPFSRAG
jgi:hypothetical protein